MWNSKLSGQNVSVLESGEHHQFADHRYKNKELNTNQGEDSGFLSGPQNYSSSQIEVDDDDDDDNIITDSKNHSTDLKQSYRITCEDSAFDSGAITDNEFESSNNFSSGSNNKSSENMILTNNIQYPISEWMAGISLKDQNDLSRGKREEQKGSKLWELIYAAWDEEGDTQLHISIIRRQPAYQVWEAIKLAPAPWLLDIKNNWGAAPIHLAAHDGQSMVIRYLLIAGAKPSIRDKDGNTPLHIACLNNDLSSVQALTLPISVDDFSKAYEKSDYAPLIQNCAKLPCKQTLEQKNFSAKTCVHIAVENNNIEILRYLLYAGADINARKSCDGYTALHTAVTSNNVLMVQYLLQCKHINVDAMTNGRLTAYQLARILGYDHMTAILRDARCHDLSPPSSDLDTSDDSDFD